MSMENKTEGIQSIGLKMETDDTNKVANLALKKDCSLEGRRNVEDAVLKRLVDPSEATECKLSENKFTDKLITKVQNDSSISGAIGGIPNELECEAAKVVEVRSRVDGNLVIETGEDSFVVENRESVKGNIGVNGFNLKMEDTENLVQGNECNSNVMKNDLISGKEVNFELTDLSKNNTSTLKNESEIKSTVETNDTSVHLLNENCGTTKASNTSPEFVAENALCQEDLQGFLTLEEILNIKRAANRNIFESSSNVLPQSDHSTVISNGKVCVGGNFNSSLNQIMNYSSDSDVSDTDAIKDNFVYRIQNKIFSEDSDTDSESDVSSSSSSTSLFFSNMSDCENSNEDDNGGAIKKTTNHNKNYTLKTKGELSLVDLPPVEDLNITVLEDECLPIGKVFQIVDQLVVVQSLKQTPVVDLDSILFLEGGKPLGQVFDVFGPVTEPYYCVRFNSHQQIKERNIQKDQTVYIAPKTKHTSYVFVSQLLKLKGSDASWSDNNEPPKNCLDYSDDEQERVARKSQQTTVKTEVVDVDEPVRKRPSVYEQRMNERNLRMSERASFSKSGYRGRASHGRPFPKSEIIWPPTMCPQSPMPSPTFSPFNNSQPTLINNSQLLPPSPNYQFGRPPFLPPPQLNHPFSSVPYNPFSPQQYTSPLSPPSSRVHPFRGSPLPPPPHVINHQFPNPSQHQINPQFQSSPILPPPASLNHQFRGPPFRPPMYQFGSSLDRFNF